MDLIIKEYGGLILSIIGASLAFLLISMLTLGWASNSRLMIAKMTGVSLEQTQYINDVEE